jgi:signal transduction histidine kinase
MGIIIKNNRQLHMVSNILSKLKAATELNLNPAILCKNTKDNPNYFSIIFANKKFYKMFRVTKSELAGKNYDFLFSEPGIEHSFEDRMEYMRLINAVKDFCACSITIDIAANNLPVNNSRFKVTFKPNDIDNSRFCYASFTFEKINSRLEIPKNNAVAVKEVTFVADLLQNLERSLRKETMLHKVSALIVSDMPTQEIAQKITETLCHYLKADRCIIHDYNDSQTSFVAEYHNNYTKSMINNRKSLKNREAIAKYINFQTNFHHGNGVKLANSSVIVVKEISEDQNFSAIYSVCKEFCIVSQISVITGFNDKPNGALYVHCTNKREWLPDEVELAQVIANQFAISIERSRSIEQVMVANHNLIEKTLQLKQSLKYEQEIRKMQTEFVALVSHEFKTPLQIIDSTRELLVRKIRNSNLPEGQYMDNALERIRLAIERMNGLINSTLNLAKMESGENNIVIEKEAFDLKKLIFEVIERNSGLALNKNIKIITKINQLPAQFFADSKLLDHVITNIVSNAIKYSADNSAVKIFAKSNNQLIALRIVDHGIGIPDEDLSNVGKKFFRAKNTLKVPGTGIGIYLARHFTEIQGGKLFIKSKAGFGTSITIILPITIA